MNSEETKEEQEVKWGGFLNEFLWTCAGVNKSILRQCPTDYAKYAGIGGTILFTALMAMLSGGYTLSTVFRVADSQTNWLAIGFGLFWGLLIFNLDRFIVNTMYSDGKYTISWGEIGAGAPRILMAFFLGLVISTPIELKIFESEINVELRSLKKDEVTKYTEADKKELEKKEQELEILKNSPLSTTFDPLTGNQQIDQLIREKNKKLAEYNTAVSNRQNALRNYQITRNDSTKRAQSQQYHTQFIKLKNEAASLNTEISNLTGQINVLRGNITESTTSAQERRDNDEKRIVVEIDALKKKIENAKNEYEPIVEANLGGFQGRMLAFGRLKDKHTTTKWSAWCIMILFIIIEIAPTFFKMMIAAGPYDDLLRSEMHKARVMSDKKISDINDELNTQIRISTEKNRLRLESEVAANKQLMERIASVQAELLTTAIEKWREEELQKIQENPSAYIHTGIEK